MWHRYWLLLHLENVGRQAHFRHGLSADLDHNLEEELESAQDAFTRRWGLYHRCSRPGLYLLVLLAHTPVHSFSFCVISSFHATGCCTAAGADGHMKCRRSICSNSRQEQYIECESVIGGKVRTGCTNTPMPGSRYCSKCQGCAVQQGKFVVQGHQRRLTPCPIHSVGKMAMYWSLCLSLSGARAHTHAHQTLSAQSVPAQDMSGHQQLQRQGQAWVPWHWKGVTEICAHSS